MYVIKYECEAYPELNDTFGGWVTRAKAEASALRRAKAAAKGYDGSTMAVKTFKSKNALTVYVTDDQPQPTNITPGYSPKVWAQLNAAETFFVRKMKVRK